MRFVFFVVSIYEFKFACLLERRDSVHRRASSTRVLRAGRYGHYPTYAEVTIRKVRRKSNLAQIGNGCTYSQLRTHTHAYARTHKEVQLKSKLQRNRTWSVAAWPPRHMRHRPATHFPNFRPIARTFSQGKNSARLQNVIFLFIFPCP